MVSLWLRKPTCTNFHDVQLKKFIYHQMPSGRPAPFTTIPGERFPTAAPVPLWGIPRPPTEVPQKACEPRRWISVAVPLKCRSGQFKLIEAWEWYFIPTPLKNMSSSIGMFILNIWENKKCSKPPTSFWYVAGTDVFFTHVSKIT